MKDLDPQAQLDALKLPPKLDGGEVFSRAFGTIVGSIGAGLAAKTNERTLLVAAAVQALAGQYDALHTQSNGYGPDRSPAALAKRAVEIADAVLRRLEEVPDPRAAAARPIP